MAQDNQKFADLGWPRSVWAIGAVHGDVERLRALHGFLAPRFNVGDRLVYLGNLIGYGPAPRAAIDEVIGFRRALLGQPGMLVSDIVYLRGHQEEMWHKLLQLQFAPNPQEVLEWMLPRGLEATLAGYHGNPREGLAAAREGAVQLTRWTGALREAMRTAEGHGALFNALRRAAYTTPKSSRDSGMLLVAAGIDTGRALAAQGDAFWWNQPGFDDVSTPYEGYGRLVRGLAPEAALGVRETPFTLTLDGGCGRGGTLVAAQLGPSGQIEDLVEI